MIYELKCKTCGKDFLADFETDLCLSCLVEQEGETVTDETPSEGVIITLA